MIDRNRLYVIYNATSTDDGNGDIESYEDWLERQLISRLARLEELSSLGGLDNLKRLAHNGLPNECINGHEEVKFCSTRQGEGNECKHCSHYLK